MAKEQKKNAENPSAEALVFQAQKGDPDAFAKLTARYMELIRSLAAPLHGNLLDNDDLFQEGLLGLYQAVESFSEKRGVSFSAYARGCVRNQMRSACRRANSAKRQPSTPSIPLEEEAMGSFSAMETEDPETVVLLRERLQMVKHLIQEQLSDSEQTVLKLYLGGFTYPQIADSLHISAKAVDNTLYRVRVKLRKLSETAVP